MELYFTYSDNITENEAEFDKFESQHLIKTMRKKAGDTFYFTDGKGKLFKGKITVIKPRLKVQHTLIRFNYKPKISLTIGVGFIRHSRLDMIIEKGTELGVNTFYLFSSKNSQYFTTNIGHWEKIARQAIKQSLRFHLPEIHPLAEFVSFLESVENYQYKYLADQNASINMMTLIKDLNLNSGDKVIFAIGPEGGFTEKEIQIAQDNGFIPVSMGDYRLRTETAVLSVAAYLNLFRN